jgi:hypothetical protein
LENRLLFKLALVHQELHRPPLVLDVHDGTPPPIIQQTVAFDPGPNIQNGSIYGFEVSTPDAQGNYLVSGQFDVSDNAPGMDIDSSIAVGDLNGDGLPDVALKLFSITGQPTPVGQAVNERIVQFFNTGGGHFVEGPTIALDEGFSFLSKKGYDYYKAKSGLSIADVDGDKIGDIVSWTDGSVSTILSTEKLIFRQEFGQVQAQKNARIAGIADLDGDGHADLVSYENSAIVVRGWDPKTKQFIDTGTAALPKDLSDIVTDIRIGDFNRDGLPDLVVFADNLYSVGINVTKFDPPSGVPPVYGFSWGTTQSLSPQYSPADVGVGDVNGDGTADLFLFRQKEFTGHVTLIK